MFVVVKVPRFDLSVGRLNPVLGKKPSVPDNEIAWFQLFVGRARPVLCRVVQVLLRAKPGEGEAANPFAEAGFGSFIDFRLRPLVDQVPHPGLVFLGQSWKPLNEVTQRLRIILRPCECEIEGPAPKLVSSLGGTR